MFTSASGANGRIHGLALAVPQIQRQKEHKPRERQRNRYTVPAMSVSTTVVTFCSVKTGNRGMTMAFREGMG
jgi:hypothetical protein